MIELGPTLAALNENGGGAEAAEIGGHSLAEQKFADCEINEPWLDAIELAIRNDYAIRLGNFTRYSDLPTSKWMHVL